MNRLHKRIAQQFAAREQDFDRASRWVVDPTLLREIEQALELRHHQVLEVCCGTGQVGGALAAGGAYVVGVDLSPQMLARAATRLAETFCADAHELPLPDGSFQRLVLRQAWHFLDAHRASAELFRVASDGAVLVAAQIVPFGKADAEYLQRIHEAKQRDLRWFPTEEGLVENLSQAGWQVAGRKEILLEEEIGAWLKWAPETGENVPEVIRLIRESPESYRRLHRVREDGTGLWDTFRWVLLVAKKPSPTTACSPRLLEVLRCPHCHGAPLGNDADQLRCRKCGAVYPVDAGIPRFAPLGEIR